MALTESIEYDKIDLYGTGTDNPIKNKSEGCIDYMFQIAIENTEIEDLRKKLLLWI